MPAVDELEGATARIDHRLTSQIGTCEVAGYFDWIDSMNATTFWMRIRFSRS